MIDLIIIDCGHAKETKGKRSPDSKFFEYKYNREIGKRVAKELDRLGIKNHFTYPIDKDFDLGLSKRAEQANAWARGNGAGKTLFVSIHSNAAGNGSSWSKATGWEVYTTKGNTNSDKYATIFCEEAEKVCSKYGKKVRKDMSDGDPDKEENFTVIYKTICPSVLIEEFFYDNKEEMEWMMSEEGKAACTEIIVNALRRITGK